jgi:hypothetical protein
MRPATVDRRPHHSPKALLIFEYDPQAQGDLKRFCGARWDPDRKTWTCPQSRAHHAADVLRRHGYVVDVLTGSEPPRWVDLFDALFGRVPAPQRIKLYRALSLVAHPDAGGDTRVMQELNEAARRVGVA